MVLFTSHEMLRATYYSIKDTGVLDEFTLFAQGISGGSRMRLLRNFQNFEKAVLLGQQAFGKESIFQARIYLV